jgi:23S rRNA pseudouridine1911/1915/1917 synthase
MMPADLEEEDYSPSDLATPNVAGERVVELTVPADLAGSRLDQALAALLPDYSRSRLTAMLKDALIKVGGEVLPPKSKLLGGEHIQARLRPRAEESAFVAEDVPLDVIHEDEAIIVINKPAGLVVHPAAGNWQGTLLNGLLYRNPQVGNLPRGGIVHRLDKDTTGVMVAAKTEAAQLSLVRQLQGRTMSRIYTALVRGQVPGPGKVDAPIGRHSRDRTKMAVISPLMFGESSSGKPAVTHYKVLEHFGWHTLLECRLETGRTHQIRVHMQSIGYPLEGDLVYGPPATPMEPYVRETLQAFGRQALHARRLTLEHPLDGKPRTYEAPLPDDMQALIEFVAEL